MISRGSLDRLRAELGAAGPVDGRRFRMLLEIDGVPAHAEDDWIGSRIAVGEAQIDVGGDVGRCVITTLDPDRGTRDLDTLGALAAYRREGRFEPLPFGVYGAVAIPGRVRVGDPVIAGMRGRLARLAAVICDRLEHPIVQAPLAGGPSTVDLAVAVCAAGGLGFLAGGYRTAAAVRAEIHATRARTDAPFGVNVFVPAGAAAGAGVVAAFARRLEGEAARTGSPSASRGARTTSGRGRWACCSPSGPRSRRSRSGARRPS